MELLQFDTSTYGIGYFAVPACVVVQALLIHQCDAEDGIFMLSVFFVLFGKDPNSTNIYPVSYNCYLIQEDILRDAKIKAKRSKKVVRISAYCILSLRIQEWNPG